VYKPDDASISLNGWAVWLLAQAAAGGDEVRRSERLTWVRAELVSSRSNRRPPAIMTHGWAAAGCAATAA
jgi:hypothetical protein